jgi:tellurite resistance protein
VSEPAHGPSYAELRSKLGGEELAHVETREHYRAAKARVAQLEATLDDVARGSTHELVRYLLEKVIAAEKRSTQLEAVHAAAQAVAHLHDQGEMAPSLLEALATVVAMADGEDEPP